MSCLLLSHFASTIEALKLHRSRNFLTILGISIGAACISLVLALTNGAQCLSQQELSDYPKNTLLLRSKSSRPNSEQSLFSASPWLVNNGLPSSDLSALQALPEVSAASPLLPFLARLESSHNQLEQQTIIGTTPDFIDTVKLSIDKGQFLTDGILPNSAVIGHDLAKKLFDRHDAVGKTFKLRQETFVVVGILKPYQSSTSQDQVNYNQVALINFDVAERLSNGASQIPQINLLLQTALTDSVLDKLQTTLKTKHKDEHDFLLINPSTSSTNITQAHRELSNTALLIAVIALVVGGIGVMNIMLVNVAEQTREIGIRRAIGATGDDIIGQFLVESTCLSGIGGLFGYILSLLVALLFRAFLPFPAIFSWRSFVSVILVTIIVGLIAGLIPALKASSKDPIEALRQL